MIISDCIIYGRSAVRYGPAKTLRFIPPTPLRPNPEYVPVPARKGEKDVLYSSWRLLHTVADPVKLRPFSRCQDFLTWRRHYANFEPCSKSKGGFFRGEKDGNRSFEGGNQGNKSFEGGNQGNKSFEGDNRDKISGQCDNRDKINVQGDNRDKINVQGDNRGKINVQGDNKNVQGDNKNVQGDNKNIQGDNQEINNSHAENHGINNPLKNHKNITQSNLSKELPQKPPRKEFLLARATTPLGRLWVHVKWPLLRNDRPFSLDEISAFASWLIMGYVLWVLLGTTTFVLSAIYFLEAFGRAWDYVKTLFEAKTWTNALFDEPTKELDENYAVADSSFIGWLTGKVLSAGMGVDVTFKKGSVLPKLEDGKLKFRDMGLRSKAGHVPLFEARIAELDVSLSFKKWYSGHGLITDMLVFGMQVRVQKFSATTDSSETSALIDPDYHLQHIRIRDSRFDICDQDTTTHISVFNCDMPRLRGNKLLMDFFNASIVTGTVNNSMFSVHKNQAFSGGNSVKFELKGIDLGYLSANPRSNFNWLVAGKADISANIRMPDWHQDDSISTSIASFLHQCVSEYGEATKKVDTIPRRPSRMDDDGLIKGAIISLYETFQSEKKMDQSEYVVVNASVRFSELKACMPSQLPSTSSGVPFVTLQGLRSLVTYINETEQPLTIKTYGIERVGDLDDLSSLSQTKIYECIVGDIYDEMLEKLKVEERRIMEEKAVHWSHALMGQLFLIGLGVIA